MHSNRGFVLTRNSVTFLYTRDVDTLAADFNPPVPSMVAVGAFVQRLASFDSVSHLRFMYREAFCYELVLQINQGLLSTTRYHYGKKKSHNEQSVQKKVGLGSLRQVCGSVGHLISPMIAYKQFVFTQKYITAEIVMLMDISIKTQHHRAILKLSAAAFSRYV